ncbi:MAG: endolytic transglycosylase MltG [Rhodocyclaceae bacterium]|nr:endolytic transglycosylase MltG [Rhodocyclaceae bacterium]
MKTLKIIFLLILLFFTAAIWITTRFFTHDLPLNSARVSFTIPAGASLQSAAQRMESAGVEMPAWQLTWFGRVMGRASTIKAGSYEIERGITAIELINKLTRGEVTMADVLLVEGKTFAQWRATLNEHPDLAHDSLKLSDEAILKRIGAPESNPEGIFFPDTYLVDKGSSDLEVLRRARAAMAVNLGNAWAARDTLVKLADPYALLTLASVVEKETGLAADRPQIAAVFANRLRKGMPLQSDPTVIYGMGAKFDGNLRRLDLMTDSPWNTYTRTGLPITPIAMPGMASLMAVSRPPPSDYLYFVARGDGSSEFSTTLEEHNRAVAKYQK